MAVTWNRGRAGRDAFAELLTGPCRGRLNARTPKDKGSPYDFTTAARLLDDFWREVKRTLDEKGIRNDL